MKPRTETERLLFADVRRALDTLGFEGVRMSLDGTGSGGDLMDYYYTVFVPKQEYSKVAEPLKKYYAKRGEVKIGDYLSNGFYVIFTLPMSGVDESETAYKEFFSALKKKDPKAIWEALNMLKGASRQSVAKNWLGVLPIRDLIDKITEEERVVTELLAEMILRIRNWQPPTEDMDISDLESAIDEFEAVDGEDDAGDAELFNNGLQYIYDWADANDIWVGYPEEWRPADFSAAQQNVKEQIGDLGPEFQIPPKFKPNQTIVYLKDGEGRYVRDVPLDEELKTIPKGTAGKIYAIEVDDAMSPPQHVYEVRVLLNGKVYSETIYDEAVDGYIAPAADRLGAVASFTPETSQGILNDMGIYEVEDINEFNMGMGVEMEHKAITAGDPHMTARIVLDHLKEDPHYYTKLRKVEAAGQSFFSDVEEAILDLLSQPSLQGLGADAEWIQKSLNEFGGADIELALQKMESEGILYSDYFDGGPDYVLEGSTLPEAQKMWLISPVITEAVNSPHAHLETLSPHQLRAAYYLTGGDFPNLLSTASDEEDGEQFGFSDVEADVLDALGSKSALQDGIVFEHLVTILDSHGEGDVEIALSSLEGLGIVEQQKIPAEMNEDGYRDDDVWWQLANPISSYFLNKGKPTTIHPSSQVQADQQRAIDFIKSTYPTPEAQAHIDQMRLKKTALHPDDEKMQRLRESFRSELSEHINECSASGEEGCCTLDQTGQIDHRLLCEVGKALYLDWEAMPDKEAAFRSNEYEESSSGGGEVGSDEEGGHKFIAYPGDLIDFGPYGRLFLLHFVDEKKLWVTDEADERYNPQAAGWFIDRFQAEGIVERGTQGMQHEEEEDEPDKIAGASSLFISVDGNEGEVRRLFELKKAEDRSNFGQGNYFDSFSGVTFDRSAGVFTDDGEAREFILSRSQKWEDAIAVQVVEAAGKPYWLIGGWAAE